WRIYKRLGATRLDIVNFPVLRGQSARQRSDQQTAALQSPDQNLPAGELARRALLDRFAPAAVLVDAAGRVVYFHGSTRAYLEQPTGEPSNDVFTMAREGLVTKLRSSMRKARDEGSDVSFEVKLRHSGGHRPVMVTAPPITGAGKGHILISFAPVIAGEPRTIPAPPENPSQVADLRDELATVRSELQNTIENLETANEELKAANEEATSMNEELQSTNEELETSKEEMQSFNEELHTVNSQLQSNVRDLEDSTNDLNNLLAGTDTATLFLDDKFCIKWFTPGLRELLDLLPADIGRPLEHFALKFRDDNLLSDAGRVLHKLQVLETEVSGIDGRWHLRRMLPYRTLDNRIAGVVITFFDVTDARTARQASTEARIYAQAIVDTVRQPLLVMDDALNLVSINPAFETLFRVSEAEEIDKSVFDLAKGRWRQPEIRSLLANLIADGKPFNDIQVYQSFPALGHRNLLINGRKLLREGGRPSLILLAIEDVTERLQSEAALRHLAAIVDSSHDAIISIDAEGLIDSWNPGAVTVYGFTAAEMIGKPLSVLNDPGQPDDVPDCLARFREGAQTLHYEVSRMRANGTPVWVSVTQSPLRDLSGALMGASSIARDITDRRTAEHQRGILMNELNHRVKNSLAVVQAIASQTLRGDISLPDARLSFTERLRVLARAHDLLVASNWSGTDLASVIEATVDPHLGGQSRFDISGPYVALRPQLAVTFSLALHELCTNASKYGALSVPEGRVDIAWTVTGPADKPRLWWQWAESGGPVVKAPVRKGFGSSLIEKVLPMELLGEVSVEYSATGVVCVLRSPVPGLDP
ncbi:MAG: PAS domain-containing protein, partial [Microgenomates group bacterium]